MQLVLSKLLPDCSRESKEPDRTHMKVRQTQKNRAKLKIAEEKSGFMREFTYTYVYGIARNLSN